MSTALHGGEEITAQYRDGASEPVTVRALPAKLLRRWGELQGDEASLVEFYCDKLDLKALYKRRGLSAREVNLLRLIGEAKDLEENEKLQGKLETLQAEILDLEAAPRWDDSLTPESHDEIYQIGERINRPLYERWTENTRESTARFQKHIERIAGAIGSSTASTNGSPSSPSAPAALARS